MAICYTQPPIVEAVCEFRFAPDGKWDNAMPGLVFGALRDLFPHRSPAKRLQFRAPTGDQAPNVQIDEFVRLGHIDRKDQIFVHVGVHHISIHYLAPYRGWAEYRPLIERALIAYLGNAEPARISRVGLRYVNRIANFPKDGELRDHLNIYPELRAGLPQSLGSFQMVVAAAEAEAGPGGVLQLSVRSVPGDDHAVMLDLDCFNEVTPPPATAEAMAWVDAAHGCVAMTFDRCLAEPLQSRLGRTGEEVPCQP